MATAAYAASDRNDAKRLAWLLDKMIQTLKSVPPEVALSAISGFEPEAADLVESSGLADELGVPFDIRPVFHRTDAAPDAHGLPQLLLHRVCGPRGALWTHTFDWSVCNALKSHDGSSPEYIYQFNTRNPKPDAKYVGRYIECLLEWKDEALAPRRSSIPNKNFVDAEAIKRADEALAGGYLPPPVTDIFAAGNEWLEFDILMTLYKAHVDMARMQREIIRAGTSLQETFNTRRIEWELQVSRALEPFMQCIHEHLKRVVREHPQQLDNVMQIREHLFRFGRPEIDAAADVALAKAIELIRAVHNGHPPVGRPEPIRDASGAVVATRWVWAGDRALKSTKGSNSKDSNPSAGEWCSPMSKAEMARRITGNEKARARKIEFMLEQWELRQVKGNLWVVRLDLMDLSMRKRFEAAPKR